MKKYELTNDTIEFKGKTLYRIKALKDFADVKSGDFGGYIEKEDNLSHCGNCWVFDNAKVFDNALVCGDVKVYGYAQIYDNALVCGDCWVFDNAHIFGNAWVCDDAKVFNNAEVYDNAQVYNNSVVYDNAKVFGCARIYGYSDVCGNAQVFDNFKEEGKIMENKKIKLKIGDILSNDYYLTEDKNLKVIKIDNDGIIHRKYEGRSTLFESEYWYINGIKYNTEDIELDIPDNSFNPSDETHNPVSKPSHYQLANGRELIDVIFEIVEGDRYTNKQAICIYNLLKYGCRAPFKNGAEDIDKMVEFANIYKETL